MKSRVVITGSAFFSPLGNSGTDVIFAMVENRTAFKRADFDLDLVVAKVPDFNLKTHTGRYKNARYLNRGAAFGVASALRAVKDSGLSRDMLESAGLFTGAGPNLDREERSALWILKFLPNTAAAAIADLVGIHGEGITISTACATTLQVVGEAFQKIKNGNLDVALAGGGDSRVNPGAARAYKMAGALSTVKADPDKVHRPFDLGRKGFVMGEGGGFVILESLDHAKKRGANILAEVAGAGTSMDGGNMTAPESSGIWMEKAVKKALTQAELPPDKIDVVSTHGTGTQLNDAMETALMERLFVKKSPRIIALKSWIGHLSTACGVVELSICLSLMKKGILPAIRNLKDPSSPYLDFMTESRETFFNTLLLQNFGFGGQNAALVVKKWRE
ncbi:3-oxoacyl-[acyl-carrier-protein] synthase II [Desulfocicer vacuolatum DSM 3385]|uniref:Nodulation protein E n=1 Tax=Desulfocicer vacuolatum DSM 3385 TaxID=1121400 RepID=A0A1W2DT02_9BACT|nr:beta-ketoacyl-[acyl-carrier-protein] synthase family protein [Desulfocicer vacuolatum]SMD00162.1 3-oxoacyl-[acyl-carrier-protein] synthase II [Desulfocicer vacuolatum DSM 3385]